MKRRRRRKNLFSFTLFANIVGRYNNPKSKMKMKNKERKIRDDLKKNYNRKQNKNFKKTKNIHEASQL